MAKTITKTKETKIEVGHITKPGEMTIIMSGGELSFYTDKILVMPTLELGQVYTLHVDYSFNKIRMFPVGGLDLPKKLYDFEKPFRDQVLASLRTPKGNMNVGVLLEGYKGQGKSVIAKQLAIESGLPIILINSQIPKSVDFQSILDCIRQDYVLLIDEFEKLFAENDSAENKFHTQDSFLGLLDGTHALQHKRLVIFTTNKEIGDKFINRPSRIRYYKKYNFMKKEQFDAIVKDKLKNKSLKKDLIDNINIGNCTIDILTTIIEEMNIHNKPYSEFKEFFNHKEKDTTYSRYKKDKDGDFKYQDDVVSKKEIGMEDEYIKNLVGHQARVNSNDGDTIIYTIKEWHEIPGQLDFNNEPKEEFNDVVYKLIKQKYLSSIPGATRYGI